ncbi:MAG TPA: hypothetical protein VF662_12500 [Allosphingosinicella sp.]|jgi:hypothetical protein
MRYDLILLDEFCRELGLSSRLRNNSSLEVSLGDEAVLCFVNAERDEDCLMGFADTPWHTHGDLIFSDHHGYFVELDPLNVLAGLQSGDVLICDQEVSGSLVNRWLVHKIFNDEFKHLMPNERLVFRRAVESRKVRHISSTPKDGARQWSR